MSYCDIHTCNNCIECALGKVESVIISSADRIIHSMKREVTQKERCVSSLEILSRKTSEFYFTTRTRECLKAEGIKRLSDLVECTESRLLNGINFGKKSLNEVKYRLNDVGLSLKEDEWLMWKK